MDEFKKTYIKEYQRWQEHLDIIFKYEEQFKVKLKEQYKKYLGDAIEDFKTYGWEHQSEIIEMKNYIDLSFGSGLVRIRISFDDPKAADKYIFEFSKKENNFRNEYVIYILPQDQNLQIPKWSLSTSRPKPKSYEEAKFGIEKLTDEILQLEDKEKTLLSQRFFYAFHDVQKKEIVVEELRKFERFSEIINNLMGN